MKKAISACLLLIFVLVGCTGQDSNKQDESDKTLTSRRILDFGQPEEPAGIRGLVKSIIGNEVTILKIARPQVGENDNMKEYEGDEQKDSSGTQGAVPSFSGHGTGMGMGARPSSGLRDDDERLAMLKSMSAGEEKVIIPVGIKMLKNEDKEMVEAGLDDVKTDQMLMIWTDKTITDRNIANFVIIN